MTTSVVPVSPDADVARVSSRYHRLMEEAADPHEWAYAWRTELNRGGFRAVDFLMEEVGERGKCIGWGAGGTACPVAPLDYADERPVGSRTDACVLCVLCAEVCPVLRPQDKDLSRLVEYRQPRRDGGYAPYSYGLYARATRDDILARSQDGGVVSALLIHALEEGTINGAVLGDRVPGNEQIGRHRPCG